MRRLLSIVFVAVVNGCRDEKTLIEIPFGIPAIGDMPRMASSNCFPLHKGKALAWL